MTYQFFGGPLDGLKIDMLLLDVGFHRVADHYGYYFDGASFHHEYIHELKHVTKSGHTWLFLYTCRRRLARACGYLVVRCQELWTWQDAAAVTQKLRDIEWRTK